MPGERDMTYELQQHLQLLQMTVVCSCKPGDVEFCGVVLYPYFNVSLCVASIGVDGLTSLLLQSPSHSSAESLRLHVIWHNTLLGVKRAPAKAAARQLSYHILGHVVRSMPLPVHLFTPCLHCPPTLAALTRSHTPLLPPCPAAYTTNIHCAPCRWSSGSCCCCLCSSQQQLAAYCCSP